jgi:putative MATE family efflux protein
MSRLLNSGRDRIDFEHTDISRLFIGIFVPTLTGLLFGGLFNIADGIFVGRGVGSAALAAVNLTGPLFLVCTGIGLMFGAGVSVVAAVHMAQGNLRAARICATQALLASFAITLIISLLSFFATDSLCRAMGCSEELLPMMREYVLWLGPTFCSMAFMMTGQFVIRLDGSPRYAMYVSVFSSLMNIFLDWLFVFPLDMGLMGAAFASSVTLVLAALMVAWYRFFRSRSLSPYRLKLSPKSLCLTVRNLAYMARLGFPTLVGEGAIGIMMFVGNYVFMDMLKEEGVAAFGIACYLLPLVFMFGNAIAQSALPIISYSRGRGEWDRAAEAIRFAATAALVFGLVLTAVSVGEGSQIAGLFVDRKAEAYSIACRGLPLFSLGFLFFTLNVALIGIYQAMAHDAEAVAFMLLRGIVVLVPSLVLLPAAIGFPGLWLAVPLSELATFAAILVRSLKYVRLWRGRKHGGSAAGAE